MLCLKSCRKKSIHPCYTSMAEIMDVFGNNCSLSLIQSDLEISFTSKLLNIHIQKYFQPQTRKIHCDCPPSPIKQLNFRHCYTCFILSTEVNTYMKPYINWLIDLFINWCQTLLIQKYIINWRNWLDMNVAFGIFTLKLQYV